MTLNRDRDYDFTVDQEFMVCRFSVGRGEKEEPIGRQLAREITERARKGYELRDWQMVAFEDVDPTQSPKRGRRGPWVREIVAVFQSAGVEKAEKPIGADTMHGRIFPSREPLEPTIKPLLPTEAVEAATLFVGVDGTRSEGNLFHCDGDFARRCRDRFGPEVWDRACSFAREKRRSADRLRFGRELSEIVGELIYSTNQKLKNGGKVPASVIALVRRAERLGILPFGPEREPDPQEERRDQR